ncbi:hypothetical protein DIPPA_33321 [Diplonema papillatum]|nr:hypothetical protein DIPPA_33321 [Diplonema papillatum]
MEGVCGKGGFMKVAFLHPDLGIGGAERLVVDAAVGLIRNGHDVTMYTSHHTPSHCFAETRDGTLKVVVAGDWMPRHVAGKGHVLFATLRMLWLTLYCLLFAPPADVYVVDQVTLPLLLMRLFSKTPSLFYCHFPDKLCDATLNKKRGLLRRVYRTVFDSIEEQCMRSATRIVYNSKFTKATTAATFSSIKSTTDDDVLYPPMNWSKLNEEPSAEHDNGRLDRLKGKTYLLSINRFEGKKNVKLALEAYNILLQRMKQGSVKAPCAVDDVFLVLAGGYDPRLLDNVNCLAELHKLVDEYKLGDKVVFVTSFTEYEKYSLLHNASALIYTPTGEHFGIVPLEAMYCGIPVVAVNSAGPTETVLHGKTGYLEEPNPAAFAEALAKLLADPAKSMAATAKAHVVANFSLNSFTSRLTAHLRSISR